MPDQPVLASGSGFLNILPLPNLISYMPQSTSSLIAISSPHERWPFIFPTPLKSPVITKFQSTSLSSISNVFQSDGISRGIPVSIIVGVNVPSVIHMEIPG